MPSASYPFICYSTFRYSIYHSSTEAGPEANVSGPVPRACALSRGAAEAPARVATRRYLRCQAHSPRQ